MGENLGADTGSRSWERTTVQVLLSSGGTPYTVGAVNNTEDDFINVILLDIIGLVGAPITVDRVRLLDATGTMNPVSECLDVDGIVRLNSRAGDQFYLGKSEGALPVGSGT